MSSTVLIIGLTVLAILCLPWRRLGLGWGLAPSAGVAFLMVLLAYLILSDRM